MNRANPLRNLQITVVAMVAAVTLVPLSVLNAASASASTRQCATYATVVHQSSSGSLIWYDAQMSHNGSPYRSNRLARGGMRWWELHGGRTLTLSFGGNTFSLSGNAIFALTCSGVSRAQGAIMPTMTLLQGTVVTHTTRRVLGAVIAEEALVGPVTSNPAMTYTVARTLNKANPTPMQKFYWVADYSNQPTGTLSTKTASAGKLVNVTPYVGPRIGSCRHVKSAKLHTTSWGHGWAHYVF